MKKIILILILLVSSNVFPQSGWVTVSAPYAFTEPFYANFDFQNENTGYLNRDKLYKSTNGGINWFAVTTTINDNAKFKFFNSSIGYLLLNISAGQVAKTTNGGTNWSAISFGNIGASDICFLNEYTGFVSSSEGNDTIKNYVYKTTDGGINWMKYFIPSDSPFWSIRSMNFVNSFVGYAWGYTTFSKTTNGGINWAEVNGDPITAIKFLFTTENNGWALADSFRIAKTTNGGINWVKQYQLSKAWDIFFLNPSTGWFCRDKVYKTTNSGDNWYAISDTGYSIYKVKFLNENTGWCYTRNNKILITHNGGIVFISKEDETVAEFSLSQNYPNPFNPETKIKFSLAKRDFVKLDVFDITGKNVSTIVNGELSAGTYSFNFSGKDLPGGVYFYRMVSDKYSDVKRMILVK